MPLNPLASGVVLLGQAGSQQSWIMLDISLEVPDISQTHETAGSPHSYVVPVVVGGPSSTVA